MGIVNRHTRILWLSLGLIACSRGVCTVFPASGCAAGYVRDADMCLSEHPGNLDYNIYEGPPGQRAQATAASGTSGTTAGGTVEGRMQQIFDLLPGRATMFLPPAWQHVSADVFEQNVNIRVAVNARDLDGSVADYQWTGLVVLIYGSAFVRGPNEEESRIRLSSPGSGRATFAGQPAIYVRWPNSLPPRPPVESRTSGVGEEWTTTTPAADGRYYKAVLWAPDQQSLDDGIRTMREILASFRFL